MTKTHQCWASFSVSPSDLRSFFSVNGNMHLANQSPHVQTLVCNNGSRSLYCVPLMGTRVEGKRNRTIWFFFNFREVFLVCNLKNHVVLHVLWWSMVVACPTPHHSQVFLCRCNHFQHLQLVLLAFASTFQNNMLDFQFYILWQTE